jgi:hypothetical protein
MALCCPLMEDLVGNIGKKGFSAPVANEMGFIFFLIQYRAVEAEALEELSSRASPELRVRGGLSLSGDFGIAYCPSCGRKLSDWLEDNAKEASKIATTSRPFVTSFLELARKRPGRP